MFNPREVLFEQPVDFDFEVLRQGLSHDPHFRLDITKDSPFLSDALKNTATLIFNDVYNAYKKRNDVQEFDYRHRNQNNYIEFFKFKMNNAGQLIAMRAGPDVSVHSLAGYLKNRESSEFKILQDYSSRVHRQLTQETEKIALEAPLQYQRTTEKIDQKPFIASVSQSRYVHAKGPKDDINFLGTYGVGPCIAMAIVKDNGDDYPDITLAHSDSGKAGMRSFVAKMFGSGKKENEQTSVFVVSGQKDEERILHLAQLLEFYNIKAQFDFKNDRLIIDLKTGHPVPPHSLNHADWLIPKLSELEMRSTSLELTLDAYQDNGPRQEYDLVNGLPLNYMPQKLMISRFSKEELLTAPQLKLDTSFLESGGDFSMKSLKLADFKKKIEKISSQKFQNPK